MDEQRSKRIFVSYASERRDLAADVAAALTAEGCDVFFDRDSLKAGGAYDAPIRNEIERCDLFVILVSPDIFKEGSYVLTELHFAREKWPSPVGRVLPVIVSRTDRRKLDPWLRRITPLYPEGDVAAEVAAEVAALLRGSQPAIPRTALRPEVAAQQVDAYRTLWSITGVLPKWARERTVTYATLSKFSRDLRAWYFATAGGLFLSSRAYSRYAELQDALSSLAGDAADNPVSEHDYEEIRQLGSTLRRQLAVDLGTRL